MKAATKVAGRNLPMMSENKDGKSDVYGESEMRPTWKNSIVNIEANKMKDEAVSSDNARVKAMVTANIVR